MSYRQLLSKLGRGSHVVKNKYGQEIVTKPVPDNGDFDGDFDPRVLINAENLAKSGSPFQTEGEPSIENLRSLMGWDNDDITHGRICGVEKQIPTVNGTVRALVYGMEDGKAKPCIVFFHGGGFFGGSLKCVENPCKAIALYADAVVASVEYALAPEHPFPAGFNDCFDTVKYVYEHPEEFGVDKNKLGVCGDSAGANLATVCAVRDRDEKSNMIRYQALIYPPVNVAILENDEYEWNLDEYNVRTHTELLQNAIMAIGSNSDLLVNVYLSGDRSKGLNPSVSPIFADLKGVPPTLIINAEYDYLRLEGEAYGRKLAKAGVSVTNIRYCGVDHAFMDKIGQYPQAEDCMREVANHFLAAL